MPLVEYFYKPHLRITSSRLTKLNMRSLLSTPDVGELRILSCIHSEDDVHGIITLLEAANPTQQNPICAYVIRIMELVGRATPLLSPYHDHNRCKRTSSTDRIMRAFLNFSKGHYKSILIQPFTLISQYKSMHESICKMAADKHVPLIIVPFHKNHLIASSVNAHTVREFNNNLQKYATCTVGILVERTPFSLRFGCDLMIPSQFSCNIGVLYIGGSDDHEVLALAARMSNHRNVRVAVTRIVILSKPKVQNDLEAQLDDKIFGDFKARYASNNASVQCNEMTVKDSVEMIRAVQSLDNIYDLIIVGRRHGKWEGELLPEWSDYEELGVIGDVIASPDFCGERVSVLVLQHHRAGGVPNEPVHTVDAVEGSGKDGLVSLLSVSRSVGS